MSAMSIDRCWPRQIARRALLAVAISGLILAGLACVQRAAPLASVQLGVTVDEILADPQLFVGQTIVTDADAGRAIAERVMALQSQSPGQEMLAVLSQQAAEATGGAQPGERLHIVGTVQVLTREKVQQVGQELGITLDADQLLNLADQAPFLIVQNAGK